AVERAAIRRVEDGRVFPAASPSNTHWMIPMSYQGEVPPYGTNAYNQGFEEGFVDRKGNFLDREQALQRMRELKQLPDTYQGQYGTEADVTDLRKAQAYTSQHLAADAGARSVWTARDMMEEAKKFYSSDEIQAAIRQEG